MNTQPTPTEPVDSPEVLIDKHTPQLFSFLLRRLLRSQSPREDAKELLQTVFMRFCTSPNRELVRKPEPYLFRIAENVLLEFRLRQDRDVVVCDSSKLKTALRQLNEGTERPGDWSEDASEETASDQQLSRVLNQIPPMYRAVLVLRTRDGLSLDEIAQKLDITAKTAKTYLYRAIAACRAADWNR